MRTGPRTELRDVLGIGPELDEIQLQRIDGGCGPRGLTGLTGRHRTRDGVYRQDKERSK